MHRSRQLWLGAFAAAAVILAAVGVPVHAGQAERDVVGKIETYRIAPGDTLLRVARRFDLGFVELRAANPGMDVWLPKEGAEVLLPGAHLLPDAPREGIVINLAEMRLYHFRASAAAPRTYPLGIGRAGWHTPTGRTRIVRKQRNPTWYPPESIRRARPRLPTAIPPGPRNPLGKHALYLDWPAYLIHGTNKPAGIGRRISAGCIRMYPEDAATLFAEAPLGTPVTIVDQPVKVGKIDGALFVEVHPNREQADQIERQGRFVPKIPPDLVGLVLRRAGGAAEELDWDAIRAAGLARSGYPVPVTGVGAQPGTLESMRPRESPFLRRDR
jgi:L,D-transpeptidase ErfK/SrfK